MRKKYSFVVALGGNVKKKSSCTSNLDLGGELQYHVQGAYGSQVCLRITNYKH
jgi:hypothetical protein